VKVIILAAGQGIRLRPLTDNQPKCMVPFRGKPIIDYIVEAIKTNRLSDIIVIDGYKKDILEEHLKDQHIKFYTNEKYNSTNMVSTLFCAEDEMDDDVIISYADIIYHPAIIKTLIEDTADFSVVVDKDWKKLWGLRMENPLLDVETMKIDPEGFIYELGKKPQSYDEIQGQYIGLIKFKKDFIKTVAAYYWNLDKSAAYDGKNYDNMYMTSFIQSLINNVKRPKAVLINGGWVEIDSVKDLKVYEKSELFQKA
jgi:choline kinase